MPRLRTRLFSKNGAVLRRSREKTASVITNINLEPLPQCRWSQKMNRYPMLFATRHWSPKLWPRLVKLIRPLRRYRYAQNVLLNPVKVVGLSNLQQSLDSKARVLLTPNHPSHADPFAVFEACEVAGTPCHIMAAWHVFAKNSKLMRKLLQWHGCFSIDREANDLTAFRDAVHVLKSRPEPLTIFPEGDIYHCNDRVTPFREGAAAIALAAAKRLDVPVVIIPTAIRYRCASDPTDEILDVVTRTEQQLLWRPAKETPLVERIRRIGLAVVALKELEYYGSCREGNLPQRIHRLCEFILDRLESQWDLAPQDNVPKRVKQLRQKILSEQNQSHVDQQRMEQLQVQLDDLFLALQLFSYPGDYLDGDSVSIERISETVDKMEEDVLQAKTASIRCRRNVTVTFGEPVTVPRNKDRHTAAKLTAIAQSAVDELLNAKADTSPNPIAS